MTFNKQYSLNVSPDVAVGEKQAILLKVVAEPYSCNVLQSY
jgi:hypothetical protein